MIEPLEISSVHTQTDEDIKKYCRKKIGQLDRFVARKTRRSMRGEVKLKESKARQKDRFNCEVVVHLPHKVITVNESALNMYAAIDISEAKLRAQLEKYKSTHNSPKFYRHIWKRMNRS